MAPARLDNLALVQGMADTKATLRRWNLDPAAVVRHWMLRSIAVSLGLLFAVWVVATMATPDPSKLLLPGVNGPASESDVLGILHRNGLVLALHSFACLAGFIAGSSLPLEARRYRGTWARIHDKAGPLAIGFVVCATGFSLCTQAYVLGNAASTLAHQFGVSPALLLLTITPHALIELVALFLPLAAWISASRRGDWHELLAATLATTALAIPLLIIAAYLEVFVSPHLVLLVAH